MRRISLSNKIILGLLVATIFGSLLILWLFYETADRYEDASLEWISSHEFDLLTTLNNDNNQVELLLPENSQFYLSTNDEANTLPPELAALDVGIHHDIIIGRDHYHVTIKDTDRGRAILALNINAIEELEDIVSAVFYFGLAVVMVLIMAAGVYLARQAINPITRLAQHVRTLDPTERKIRIADEYKDYEVGLIAQAFDRFFERLDGYVAREQSFTAAASHELRTPLAVITTSLDLIVSDPQLTEGTRIAVERIQRSAGQMSELISTLLFLAREPEGTHKGVVIEETDFSDLLCRMVDDHRTLLNSKPVSLDTNIGNQIVVPATETHLRIIVNNLLRNAITHIRKGVIQINLIPKQLTISDTGTGIRPELISQLFQRKFSDPQSQGIGFGLYICKALCDRYGWTIKIRSELNHGTEVTIGF